MIVLNRPDLTAHFFSEKRLEVPMQPLLPSSQKKGIADYITSHILLSREDCKTTALQGIMFSSGRPDQSVEYLRLFCTVDLSWELQPLLTIKVL